MRRGRLLLIFGLATLSGCADPAIAPLKPGQNAILYELEGLDVTLNVSRRRDDGINILDSVSIPSGTRVVVLDDPPAKPPVRTELRLVTVRIDEGTHRGIEGGLNRQELRPSP